MPSSVATRRSPPQPHLSDSRPANRRRCRSSSRLANNTMAARNSAGISPASGRGRTSPGVANDRRRARSCRACCAGVGRAVEELAVELVPRQAAVADELAQRVLGSDMEQVVELLAEMSRLCLVDEGLGGCDQGAGAGEPDAAERPQSAFVEVDEFVEGVVAAAMGVAGAGGDVLELAKRGAAGAGSEGRHDLGQRGDGLLAEQGDDRVGGELGWSHSGTITDTDSVMVPEPGAARHPAIRGKAYFY